MNPLFKFSVPDMDVMAVLPILLVAVTGIVALILEMIHPKRSNERIVAVSMIGLVLSGIVSIRNLELGPYDTLSGMFRVDRFGASIQVVIALGALLAICFSENYLREKRIPFGEIYPLMLWSAVGAMIMATTGNLLVIFLGLEILSVALYVMAGLSRGEEKSNESALKYFLLGAFASGFLLYGIAFVYGAVGTLNLDDVPTAWIQHGGNNHSLMLFGFGCIIVGLAFKTSLVPFHQWTPDVYQGAPTNVTAFMATVTKAGAFAALIRVLDSAGIFREQWMPALEVVAVLTMTVGNVMALTQKDVKRILGYSSIAQAGYLLVGVLAHEKMPNMIGTSTVVYYLFGYTAMTAGVFAVVSLTARGGREGTKLDDLRGLARRSPIAFAALVVFVTSLIGIPPTAGFFGKMNILMDAVHSGLAPLAVALAINSIISGWYYLGLLNAAIGSDGTEGKTRPLRFNRGVLATCALSVAGVFIALVPPVLQVFFPK